MKKTSLVVMVLFFFSNLEGSYAQPSVSPRGLESYIRRVCPMYNVTRGDSLERRYNIKEFRDGKWSCDDRAEIAMRIANQYGYHTAYGIDKTSDPNITHRFVIVTDDEGNKSEILRSKFHPSEE